MATSSIQTRVAPQMLAKVTRLFNGTAADILTELLQNARRAGATTVRIDTAHVASAEGCTATLRIADDGHGIADPATFLALGQSDWDAATLTSEDPAGMGVFSLAGRRVGISSRAVGDGMGWSTTIPATAWASGTPVEIHGCVRRRGTAITVEVPHDWLASLARHVEHAARFFPLTVIYNNLRQARAGFLDGAVHVEDFEGVRIGVFHAISRSIAAETTIIFHGLTIRHKLPMVFELGRDKAWSARVDIIDCPALQLTLPARKELVDSAFLPRLADAVEQAVYRAIGQAPDHRLSFADWHRAADLGVYLPAAARGLVPFVPSVADADLDHRFGGEPLTGDDLIIIGDYDAAYEQSLDRAIKVGNQAFGARLVRAVPALAGYAWYDDLPAVETLRFTVNVGDTAQTVGEDLDTYLELDSDIVADLTIVDRHSVRTRQMLATDVLVLPNDDWDLDNAPIAVVPTIAGRIAGAFEPLTPQVLAGILDAAYFASSDDRDCDSFETQLRAWRDDSLRRAAILLEGKDAANRLAIVEAFTRHIAWLLPPGQFLLLTAMNGEVNVSITTPRNDTPTTAD